MTDYIASWAIFVEADNPVEAARKASEMAKDPTKATWRLVNLEDGEPKVVDLNTGQVIECQEA